VRRTVVGGELVTPRYPGGVLDRTVLHFSRLSSGRESLLVETLVPSKGTVSVGRSPGDQWKGS
jgi:hypothetical protein